MPPHYLHSIAACGYCVIPDFLDSSDLSRLQQLFECDLQYFVEFWRPNSGNPYQVYNFDVFVTSPAVKRFVEGDLLQDIARHALGEQIYVADVYLSELLPNPNGVPKRYWHRDCGRAPSHRLSLLHLQALFYLTDVDEESHCFSIVPEPTSQYTPAEGEIGFTLPDPPSWIDVTGTAGTLVLFDPATVHTAHIKRARLSRKTLSVCFGALPLGYHLYDESCIPVWFTQESFNPQHYLYRFRNQRSRTFLQERST